MAKSKLPQLPPLEEVLSAVRKGDSKIQEISAKSAEDYEAENTALKEMISTLKDRLDDQDRRMKILCEIKEAEARMPPEEHHYHCDKGDCDITVFIKKNNWDPSNKVICRHFRTIPGPECTKNYYSRCEYGTLGW